MRDTILFMPVLKVFFIFFLRKMSNCKRNWNERKVPFGCCIIEIFFGANSMRMWKKVFKVIRRNCWWFCKLFSCQLFFWFRKRKSQDVSPLFCHQLVGFERFFCEFFRFHVTNGFLPLNFDVLLHKLSQKNFLLPILEV